MFCNNVFSKTSLKLKNPRTHPTLVGKYSASKNFYGRVDFFLSEKSFFFQAEDGIRDYKVTEVQTCALPILRIHLISHSHAWIADPSTALGAVAAVDIWKTTPFVALLLLAGLQVIPQDLYEAAR